MPSSNLSASSQFTIIIANKNYSSWSLRGWLAMKFSGASFNEILIKLDQPETRAQIHKHSPSGRVPALQHGAISVWDSLSIIEYLNEIFPKAQYWPENKAARAHARSIAAEMHSGFHALRSACPMNLWRPIEEAPVTKEILQDLARIEEIWGETRAQFAKGAGANAPYLFGQFSAADMMFAPVATRIRTYGLPHTSAAKAYIDAIYAWPHVKEWYEAALKETDLVPSDEINWPVVKRINEAK